MNRILREHIALLASLLFLARAAFGGEEEARKQSDKEDKASVAQEGGEEGEEGGTSAPAAAPSIEKLLEWNGAQIFGGKTRVVGDSFEVHFNRDGQVQAGFEGKGIFDSKSEEMHGGNRKVIILEKKDNKEILIPNLTAVGMGESVWVSRFPIASAPWIEFGFRVPNLIGAESEFRLRLNWNRGSGYETNFFQSIAYLSGGSVKGSKLTALKEYRDKPLKWFKRGPSAKIEFGIRDGDCVVRLNSKDLVSMPKVADKGGRVAIAYKKILFTIDNLKIRGKLDMEWCKKQVEALRAAGKLKLSADPAANPLDEPLTGNPEG